MKEIQLTQGKIAQVDDADYVNLSKWKWYYNTGYAIRSDNSTGKIEKILMHRVIMNPPKDMQTDHINLNRLDNRRENLRICSRAENNRNVTKRKGNTSGIKGISWYKPNNKWCAQIQVNNKKINLGYFSDINLAAEAYKQASIKYHGEYGRIK